MGIDASAPRIPAEKAVMLRDAGVAILSQAGQLSNPDARIVLEEWAQGELLRVYADSFQGVSPADLPRYGRCFWEVQVEGEWRFWQSTVDETTHYGGRELV